MIADADVERAVDWLRDNAVVAAKARAERLYLESYIKTVLAQETEKAEGSSASQRESIARTKPAFLAALQAYREAIESDETHRFMRDAMSAKIEAWRTMESTRRAEGRAYS